jgi:hypothetical protein
MQSNPAYLFSGDRHWGDSYIASLILRGLKSYDREHGPEGLYVVHGCAPGLDTVVDKEGDYLGMDVRGYPADWERHGKAAGPIRNREMLDKTNPKIIFCFHDEPVASKGTRDMAMLGLTAGKTVYLIKHASPDDFAPF